MCLIKRDVGFEPGNSASEVCCATNKPPHLRVERKVTKRKKCSQPGDPGQLDEHLGHQDDQKRAGHCHIQRAGHCHIQRAGHCHIQRAGHCHIQRAGHCHIQRAGHCHI